MKLIRCISVLCALIAVAAGCDRQPMPQTGSVGTPRIVALSPAVAIILRDLGHENYIVGRHAWDKALHPSIPVVGDQSGLDYERLLGVNPTHIFTQWGSRELPARLKQLAGEQHWITHDSRLLSLDDIEREVREIDNLMTDGLGSVEGDRLEMRMKAAWTKRDGGFADVGRVLLLAAVSPPGALGPGSCHHEILTRIGATPAVTQGSPFIEMDAEMVLRLAPDAIILISPGEPPAENPDAAVARLGKLADLDIPAVREKRVAVIVNPLALTTSTPMIDLADELAHTLRSWQPFTATARDTE